jgi:hypothetical protein
VSVSEKKLESTSGASANGQRDRPTSSRFPTTHDKMEHNEGVKRTSPVTVSLDDLRNGENPKPLNLYLL